MSIKRGILQTFDPASYTASVLLFEATNYVLTGVPVANTFESSAAIPGSLCALLFFDDHNPQDAVLLATFNNGATGFPAPSPGRVTFVSGYQQVSGSVISANTVQTFTLIGSSPGIPTGTLGVLYKAYFSSTTVGAYIQLVPHGADITAYASIGNIITANSTLNGTGLLPLDGAGRIDIKANVGSCTVTLYTYGYVL